MSRRDAWIAWACCLGILTMMGLGLYWSVVDGRQPRTPRVHCVCPCGDDCPCGEHCRCGQK